MSVISGTHVITSVTLPAPATGIYVNPATGYAYADLWQSLGLAIVGETGVVTTINTHSSHRAIASNPETGYVYVAGTHMRLTSILFIRGTTVVEELPWDHFISDMGLGVNRTTGYLYVAGERQVAILSGTRVLTTVPLPGWSLSVTADPSTATVYLTNFLRDWVAILDGTSHVDTLTVGTWPHRVAVSPHTGDVYVANRASGDISVIRKIPLPHQFYLPLLPKIRRPYHGFLPLLPRESPEFAISDFHMSDRPDGPAMTDFPDDIDAVDVMFDYGDAQNRQIWIGASRIDPTPFCSTDHSCPCGLHSIEPSRPEQPPALHNFARGIIVLAVFSPDPQY